LVNRNNKTQKIRVMIKKTSYPHTSAEYLATP
jgi:hypothetical protein